MYLFQRFESQNGSVGARRLFRRFPGYPRRRRGRNRDLDERRLGAPKIDHQVATHFNQRKNPPFGAKVSAPAGSPGSPNLLSWPIARITRQLI